MLDDWCDGMLDDSTNVTGFFYVQPFSNEFGIGLISCVE